MKKSRAVVSIGMMVVLFAVLSFANEKNPSGRSAPLAKASAAMGPAASVLNINNLMIWVDRDGFFPWTHTYAASWAAEYPKGTSGLIFAEGMLWGARVDDAGTRDATKPRIRVNGATYATGMKAGKVLYDGSGNVTGADENPTDRHVWRVRADYEKADLSSDASTFYSIALIDISDDDTDGLYTQYDYDWKNWPAGDGAPYEERNDSTGYQAAVWDTLTKTYDNGDFPGEPGASQTIWLVSNDLPYDDGSEVAPTSYGSSATGMEMQLTMWAYDFAPDNPLGNMLFKRARLIYTGLAGGPADAKLDTVYFTQWSDPDLGTFTDDFVGCDTLLSLGYVYNGNNLDGTFFGDFGLPVPAGGYDFLQGPIVNGDTLGMTSFGWFGAGSAISDPDLEEYSGTLQWFNLMEGFLPRPEYPERTPWTHFFTGEITKYPLSGDPVAGTGDIDGNLLPPGDRRLLLTSGPFSMALGDTQDVVIALVGGMGGDNLSSVTVLKYYDVFAQYAYDLDFDLPSPPDAPKVAAFGDDGTISLNWGHNPVSVASTEETIKKGFSFEGYNVYQLPSATAAPSEGIKIATFDLPNSIATIFENFVDPTTGQLLRLPAHLGTNEGIHRFLHVDKDALRSRPLSNDIPYYFGITAYSFLPNAAAEGSPFQSLESSPTVVSVIPKTTSAGTTVGGEVGGAITVSNDGTSDGVVAVKVINPDQLTGDSYEVYFDQQHYYMDFDGQWKTTNYADSVGKALGKGMDLTGTSMSAIAYTSPKAGTRDLKFILDLVSIDYDYSDGVSLTFPPGITINSAEVAVGGTYETSFTPVIDAGTNMVTWGAADTTEDGDFLGGEVFTVNVVTPALPFDVDYIVWDDGWAVSYGPPYDALGAGVVHAVGTLTISEEAYAFKTLQHWNLVNTTDTTMLLEDQAVFDGVDIYTGEYFGEANTTIFDGFQINVSGGYAAPLDILSYAVTEGSGSYDIQTFTAFGYATGWAYHSFSTYAGGDDVGTQDVNILQRDLELRFTGEYDAPDTIITGTDTLIVHPIKDGTGTIATYFGATLYDMEDHPLNPDGSTNPFTIRIPFELWDTEYDNGDGTFGRQVTLFVWDRYGDLTADDFYPTWNPLGRMYVWALDKAYTEDLLDPAGAETDLLSWNLVFFESDWVTGDVVHISFANPIQLGVDIFTWTTAKPTSGVAITEADIDKIGVFPNPYYGFHMLEGSRSDKWVRFNHLPVDKEVTIRIFNLGGTMVRSIVVEASGGSQYADWNLMNQAGLPVASGLYIAYIEIDGADASKILKIAIVQETQILGRY